MEPIFLFCSIWTSPLNWVGHFSFYGQESHGDPPHSSIYVHVCSTNVWAQIQGVTTTVRAQLFQKKIYTKPSLSSGSQPFLAPVVLQRGVVVVLDSCLFKERHSPVLSSIFWLFMKQVQISDIEKRRLGLVQSTFCLLPIMNLDQPYLLDRSPLCAISNP